MTAISHARRQVEFEPVTGGARRIGYDILVVAPGSISRTLPIEGLAERGIGFKTVGEAIYLRNHVLSQLDIAASTDDPDTRRKALTFVFVGAGFAGVEALAELEDMARSACLVTILESHQMTCGGFWSRPPAAFSPRSARRWARGPSGSCAHGASISG